MRTWLAKRKVVGAQLGAMRAYGSCAHCCLREAETTIPRHHPSLGDDMREADSWLPLCYRCRSSIEHERRAFQTGYVV